MDFGNSLLKKSISTIRDHILLMGGEVERAIDDATRALQERDSELALSVLHGDDRVDALELESDRLCVSLLGLDAPKEDELRLVVTAIKITPILERIADHACNVAKAAIYLNGQPELTPHVDLTIMSRPACEMLKLSLDAFATADADSARVVIDRDDEIDKHYNCIFQELIERMSKFPETAGRATHLLMTAKHLERIGDYVTDICELVVYMKEASVIKHSRLSI